MNVTILRGQILGEPRRTELGEGSAVLNFEMATQHGGARLVAPVAWVDPSRRPHLRCGDEIVVVGAIRRRWFRAGGASQSRTEVVAEQVSRANSARATAWLDAATGLFSSGPTA